MKRFLTGLIAGLAISYLTAPRPGVQTRSQLSQAVTQRVNGIKAIKQQWDVTRDQVIKLVDMLKSQMAYFQSETTGLID